MSLQRIAASIVCLAAACVAQTTTSQTLRRVPVIPQYFEPNQGQAERGVDFVSRGPGYALTLKPTEADLQLISKPGAPGPVRKTGVRMKLLAANAHAHSWGQDRQQALSNYLIGNTPESWRIGIAHYGRVEYRDVYPGIDLAYYGNQQQLEYDFILGPQADVGRIQLEFQGANGVRIDDATGDVVIALTSGEVREKAPVVYQKTPGGRRLIEGKYIKRGPNRVGLQVGMYDRTRTLIIDPVMVFSTYFGGNGTDGANGVAFDATGNVYIVGTTSSLNLTGTNLGAGPNSRSSAAYVAKISPAGALLFATYIAGSNDQATAADVALDATGNIYMVGSTTSPSFPTANPIQSTYHGGTDAFLLELNSSGTAILFSTYIGGSGYDYFTSVMVDNSGDIFGGGATTSVDFPVQNAAQPTNTAGVGLYSAFALKLSGTALSYATYVGGNNFTNRIAIDPQGNLYVVGDVTSTAFPTTQNAFQHTYGGSTDGFVQKLSPTGTIVYSTYIGGSGTDAVRGARVDPSGNLMIAGQTLSTDFPVSAPLQSTLGGLEDGFLAKLSSDGSTLMFSTYLGGSGADRVNFLALDAAGTAYVTGTTTSVDYPTVQPLQISYGGGPFDAFLTQVNNSGSTILFSTYLGGTGDDEGQLVGVDALGNAYVGGKTTSTDFPLVNAFQAQYGGGSSDGFIAEIGFCPYTLSPVAVALGLAGGSGSFTLTTSSSCSWTATTSNSWITIAPPLSGSGSATINYSASPGTVVQAGVITIGSQSFTIVESGPVTLTSVVPASVTLGSTVPVTLNGTNFVTGAAVSVSNPGVTVSNVVVVSDTQITASLTISPSAAAGTATVTVTTAAGTSSPVNLAIVSPPLVVKSVTLSQASVVGGVSTTANTTTLNGQAPVGGVVVTLTSNNAAATVPASVTVAAGATVSPAFTINTSVVTAPTPVTISATYNGVTATATLTVTPPPVSGSPVLQLHADASEINGTQNGAIVTPSTGPAGLTGTVVVNSGGSVNFAPAASGNGVYFLNCCNNSGNAYYKFTGAALGNVFNVNQGQITFYLQSRYTFAQRKASASGQRYAFDARDGNGNHLFSFMTQVSSGYLLFTYMVGGVTSYYYVPQGTEDTLFGSGVLLQVTMAWESGVNDLYLNGKLVKSAGYTAPAANWSAGSNFDLGAFEYLTYGGYNSSDDVIDEFTVLGSPLSVSVTAPAAGAIETGPVTVTANATDIVPVTGVQFMLDGANLGSAVTGAGPAYNFSWDTTTATNGPHIITAVATDSAGNSSTSAAVSITVNNVTTPPTVSAVVLSPASVPGGMSTTGNTVTLSGPAPTGGAVVTLTSNNPAATVPPSVTVAGAASVSPAFTITTLAVATNTPVTISATYSGSTVMSTLTVMAPSPSSVNLVPASVLGGTSSTANTVTLNAPAPVGGAIVTLTSNNAAATVPASVTVAGGTTVSPAFIIGTTSVSVATPVTISASYNGVTVPATLTVGPLTASAVTLTSSSVQGGVSTTATVSLNGPAPSGGAVVALTSSDPSAAVPTSVTVAGGATVSPVFTITTSPVAASIPVTISASYNGPAATAVLTVLPPGASAVTLLPASVMGGISTTANTVTLNGPAGPTGAIVTLTSSNPAATVPASVTVAAGATVSPAFTITTSAVAASTSVTITAKSGGVTATGILTVQPPSPSTVSLSSASVTGGTSITSNTVTLNGPAPAGGAVVTLTSNNAAATAPASVTVAAGATVSPAFTITTAAVAASTPVTISATYGGATATGILTVQPPSPSVVTLSPASVLGGTSTTANTVTLNGPAPAGGAVVTLTSNNAAATVPASVTVAAGATASPAFTINTSAVAAPTPVTISATYNGVTVPATLTVGPLTPSVVTLTSSSILGGVSTTATVGLNGQAPVGGVVVTLTSNNAAATVPASVTVAAGATVSPAFTINTSVVTAPTPVTISATYNGVTATATLTVTPPPVSGSPVLQLHADASEINGTQNGAIVTPSTGPAGLTGTVVVNSGGSVNFAPAASGNGVYFLNCCNNSGNAYYKFTGAALGNVFNVNQGQITFYLQSRYTFAQRKASASGQRYAFDARDGNGNHLFSFMTQVSSGYLLFTYMVGGVTSYYYVPQGTEDTLFGSGVLLQVTMAWESGVNDLYLNGKLVKSAGYTAPAANWSAGSNFDLGAFEYLTYGGYNSSDDVIDEFTVLGSPLSVSVTAPAAGAIETGPVTVTANATDIVPVTGVQFMLDGANLGSAVTGAGPAYNFSWDTTTATNGPHIITAVATDSAGNSSTSAAVSITVNNVTTPPTVSAVVLSPASVPGGMSTTGNTVTLSGPAPTGGAVVTLTSNNPAATVPPSVTVAGAASVSPAFTITTLAVATNTPVTISATYSGSTVMSTLTVMAPSPSSVNLVPASVLGGTSSTANTVTLNAPAPVGGAIVTLTSNNAAATVPASVTVAGGTTVSPAFIIGTTSVSVATPVTISASYNGVTVPATLTVGPLTASAVTLTSSSVQGGVSTTATVSLNGPAPSGGAVVALTSSDPSAAVPTSVTVAGGATVSPVFTITTSPVAASIPVTISASYNGPAATAVLTVLPPGASAVTLLPASVMGGISTTANTVTLNGPAGPTGAIVTLTSSNPAATVPASVTVAAGATVSPAFTITTSAVAASTSVTITAKSGGVTATGILTVQPPSPSTVSLSSASVTGGTSITSNTVTLNGPAPAGGAVVTLTSNNAAATAPASVTVAAGATVSPAFTITTAAVAASTPVTISATYGGATATGILTVQPPSPSVVTLSPASVLGGTSTTANTVTLNGPAPAGGAVVTLTSNNAAATVPASVTVAAGATASPAFTINTSAVAAPTPVTISATYNGVTVPATLTVGPLTPSVVTLTSSSILGGVSTTATVGLNGQAPVGGVVVTLTSNNAAATVPASVTVAAGATVSPAFTINTSVVTAPTPVTISATYNGVTATATLTVTPPPVSGSPVLQLHADASEINGTQNGAIVTPSTGPAGLTGTVVVNSGGSVNFAPAASGNGVYFLNCCNNSGNAYYKFTGAALGNVFNVNQGQITFYLQSRYTFAQRKASASGQRYAFDARDGNGNHLFSFMTQVSSGYLLFTYMAGGVTSYYYVPQGTEDTLFGSGVLLQVSMTWGSGVSNLYLNGKLVKSVSFTAPAANWSAGSNFDLGAFEYLTYGGYSSSDDVIDEFTVIW